MVVFFFFFKFYCESLLFQVLFLNVSQGLAFWAPGWNMRRFPAWGIVFFQVA